jgi:hypothetical protein
MRLVLAVFILAACGRQASTAPAWPKMTEKEKDGGESIEPRAKAAAVASKTDDETPAVKADEKPAATITTPKTDAETPKPATTTSTQASEEIVITTEEIVIEIDD